MAGPRIAAGAIALTLAALPVLVALLLVAADTVEAEAAVCPRGQYPSGLLCCRVYRGQPRCQLNPRLSNGGERFFAPTAWWRWQPVVIDNRDITPAALATPEFAPRPISTDPRVLSTEDDVCTSAECRFDRIRALATARREQAGCTTELRTHYCRHSMWRELDIEQRFGRILVLGRPFAERFNVDVRAMPCIAAIETRFLEPLTVSDFSCEFDASDEGLPQIIRPTFDTLYRQLDFRSTVVADDGALDAQHLSTLFSAVGGSVRHQLELMAAVLAASGLNDARTNYQAAFTAYNGSFRAVEYGRRVQACFTCLRERVDPATLEIRGDPMRCLEAASGANIRQDFASFRGLCTE